MFPFSTTQMAEAAQRVPRCGATAQLRQLLSRLRSRQKNHQILNWRRGCWDTCLIWVSHCRQTLSQSWMNSTAWVWFRSFIKVSYWQFDITVFFKCIRCVLFVCCPQSESAVSHGCIVSLLLKFSAQELIEVRESTSASSSSASSSTVVTAVDHTKLWAMIGTGAGAQRASVKRKAEDQTHNKRAAGFSPSLQSSASPPHASATSITPASTSPLAGPSASGSGAEKKGRSSKSQSSHVDMEIESLLNQQSTKEQQSKKVTMNNVTSEMLNHSESK